MNDPLLRLLKAGRSLENASPEPRLGLGTRVLAHWRENVVAEAEWSAAFRPAILLASLVALTAIGLNFQALADWRTQAFQRETEWSIANSALRLAANP